MTTETTVASALDFALRPVRAQLDLAIEQITGTAQRSVASAAALLDQAQELCIEQYNQEVDEYNAVIDRLEAADVEITTLKLTLAQVDERISNAELTAAEATAAKDSTIAQNKLIMAELRMLDADFKKLKSLNPERMKTQLIRAKDDLANKTALLNQQLTEIRRVKTELADVKSKLASMVTINTELNGHVADMQARLQRIDGDVDQKFYTGNKGVQFYFYLFQWGLQLRCEERDIVLLNDIDWHFEIRTNTGIGLIVSVTEWCMPIFPRVEVIADCWPPGLTDDVANRIRELLADTHPQLIERAEWAESVLIETLPLKTQYLELLAQSKLNTLYDIVRRPVDLLCADVKGFGETTARQVRAKCMGLVKDWEKQQKSKVAA